MIHYMAYDNMCLFPKSSPPCMHSTLDFAKSLVAFITSSSEIPHKIHLGLPFYGRNVYTGEPTSYTDMLATKRLPKGTDLISDVYLNGPETIKKKTQLALDNNLAGVMIWELGQDIHPSKPKSLLASITEAVNTYYEEPEEEL
ncbi:glycoside hydrolase [Pelomyxa schiedti]|nr:glycoside hydrolase [Pelomyxa schiedti]